MRTRSRSSPKGLPTATFKGDRTQGGTKTVLVNASKECYWQNSETMQDQVNPGYFRAAREGKILPVAPMAQTSETFVPIYGTASSKQVVPISSTLSQVNEYQAEGIFLGTSDFKAPSKVVPMPSVNRAALLQSALARAQTDAWDVATFLAEFGKTIEGMTSFYSRWSAMFARVHASARARRGRFSSFADAFANAWLEARYSFRPLYYDMLSISEAVRRLSGGVEGRLARGWESEKSSPSTASQLWSASSFLVSSLQGRGLVAVGSVASGSAYRTNIASTISKTVSARATVGVSVTTRNITMVDPLVTAWELVPFSFVMDWFITTGDAIAAFSPFATGIFKYATFSLVEETVLTVTGTPAFSGNVTGSGTPGSISQITRSVTRSPTSVTPTLSIQVNLNAAKVTDLVALMWSLKLRHLSLLKQLR